VEESVKRVYVAKHPTDAHLVKGLLEGEGIPVIVKGEALWIARGEIPITPDTCPSVWVLEDSDYERAIEVLSALEPDEASPPQKSEEWRCGHCGEMNEPQFSECWQCGRDRP
jgi:hypothetical protein